MATKTKNTLLLLSLLVVSFLCNHCKREEIYSLPARLESKVFLSEKSILLSFSKDMDKKSAEDILKYPTNIQNKTKSFLPVLAEVKNKSIVLTYDKAFEKNTNYEVYITKIKSANKLSFSENIELKYGGVYKIRLTEQIEARQDSIKLEFSRKLNPEDVANTENYTLVDEKGKKVKPQKAEIKGKKMLLLFKEKFKTGDYSIEINNIKSEDGYFTLENQSYNFTFVGNFKTKWVQIKDMPVKLFSSEIEECFSLTERRKNKKNKLDRWDIYFSLSGYHNSIGANQYFYEYVNYEDAQQNKAQVWGIDQNIMDVKKVSDYQKIINNVRFTDNINTIGGEKVVEDKRISADQPLYFVAPIFIKDVEDPYKLNKEKPEDYRYIPIRLIPNRTILFKTIKGKYGKMEIQSIYKNGEKPERLTENYVFYFTFRYVIQEDGSENLDIPLDI